MALVLPDIEAITNGSNGYDIQCVPDQTDWAIGSLVDQGTYVVSGMTVTQNSGLTVSIAAGVYVINGLQYTYAGGTATGSASGASDRRDLVSINTSGTVTVTAGTVCGTSGWIRTNNSALPPVKPAVPSNQCALAEIAMPQSVGSTIATIMIVDKTALGKFGPGSGTTSGTLTATISAANITAGIQIDTTSARFLMLEVEVIGPNAEAVVNLSPDGVTYTGVAVAITVASATTNSTFGVYVPQGWYVKGTTGEGSVTWQTSNYY